MYVLQLTLYHVGKSKSGSLYQKNYLTHYNLPGQYIHIIYFGSGFKTLLLKHIFSSHDVLLILRKNLTPRQPIL
jgi:hypothetical protein